MLRAYTPSSGHGNYRSALAIELDGVSEYWVTGGRRFVKFSFWERLIKGLASRCFQWNEALAEACRVRWSEGNRELPPHEMGRNPSSHEARK